MTAPKPINPAHVGLPRLPAGRYEHFEHSTTPEDIRARFMAKHGALPSVIQLVDLSRTERPNAVWIAGPVDTAAEVV